MQFCQTPASTWKPLADPAVWEQTLSQASPVLKWSLAEWKRVTLSPNCHVILLAALQKKEIMKARAASPHDFPVSFLLWRQRFRLCKTRIRRRPQSGSKTRPPRCPAREPEDQRLPPLPAPPVASRRPPAWARGGTHARGRELVAWAGNLGPCGDRGRAGGCEVEAVKVEDGGRVGAVWDGRGAGERASRALRGGHGAGERASRAEPWGAAAGLGRVLTASLSPSEGAARVSVLAFPARSRSRWAAAAQLHLEEVLLFSLSSQQLPRLNVKACKIGNRMWWSGCVASVLTRGLCDWCNRRSRSMLRTALLSALNFLESKNRFTAQIRCVSLQYTCSWDKGCLFLPNFVQPNTVNSGLGGAFSMLAVLCLVVLDLFCFCFKGDLVVNHIISFTSSRIALSCAAFL